MRAVDDNQSMPTSPRERPGPWIAIAAVLGATVVALRMEGRIWWCACGGWQPWISNVWSEHCSQHLADPYSLSHMLHGVFFAGLFALVFKSRVPVAWQLAMAVTAAAAWEILENSAFIINRYRTETMSYNYLGDSVVNSLGDIACCGVGFVVARRLGWKWSIVLFIAIELAMLALIRDNLTLNVIMLICPVRAIREWQSAGHVPG